jgi:hypothetical protein
LCRGDEQHCIITPGTQKYFEICVNEVVFGYYPGTIETDNGDRGDNIKKKTKIKLFLIMVCKTKWLSLCPILKTYFNLNMYYCQTNMFF